MLRACAVCGAISDEARCPAHRLNPNAPRSTNRNNAAHLRFRRAVKKRDGYRCQVCGTTAGVSAHHIIPLHQGGTDDPANGVTLCTIHHKAVDPHAR